MQALLVITVLLPLLGGLVLFGLPGLDYRRARWLALGTALVSLVLSLVLFAAFQVGAAGPQFAATSASGTLTDVGAVGGGPAQQPVYGWSWLDLGRGPGIRFALGLDGVSLVLVVLTTLLMITSIFASWESIRERAPAHYALMLLLETGLLGLFAALDVVLFYIFFEFTLIPLFFLIGLYGGPERRRASVMFFLYTLAGSLLTLLGVILLVVVHYQNTGFLTFSIPGLTEGLHNLDWPAWSELTQVFGVHDSKGLTFTPWLSPQSLIFLLLFAGFAVKVPLFPFHTWLPLAHVEASTSGSILLAGVLLKVGAYGFLRFNLGMTPLGAHYWMPMLATISVIGIVYGALTALAQSDVKRLVAYSSVSHMGFITLGLFSLTSIGLDGAVMQMVNHGLTTGALFACVGVLYERYHTREMGELGGLWDRMPLLAFFLILASLGASAVPGLNGFVGEFPILLGMFTRDPIYAVLGTIGMVLGPYYLLLMVQRVVFGPLREPHVHHDGHAAEPIRRVGWHEIAGLTPLMVLIVLIGVYPKPIFDRIRPPLRQISRGFYEPNAPGTAAADAPGPAASPDRLASLTPAQDPAR